MSEVSKHSPKMALVVLQAADIEKSKAFYSLLGMTFSEEKHGAGPRHFAAYLDGLVFEIYPRRAELAAAPIRVGFHVASVDTILETLRSRGARIITEPVDSPWGRRAVVEDPDGNRVELSIRSPD